MSASRYRLVVVGELGPRYASAFEGMTIRAHDGQTEISGAIIDQSHLQGLLERIGSLGLTLHSVTSFEGLDAEVLAQRHAHRAGVIDDDRGTHSKGPETS